MGTRKDEELFFNATTAAVAASTNSSSSHPSNSSTYPTSQFTHNTSAVDDLNDCNASTHRSREKLNSSLFGISLAVTEWEAMLTVSILTVVILLTIIGNILVILSVFTYKPLRIVQNFFIVSLAVADLTVALLVLPFNVAYLVLGRWEFGITMCKLWLTCDVMCCTSSILNLCVIALDRFWAITDPINYAQKRTLNRVMLLITGVWVLSFLISSPPLVGWNDWPKESMSSTPCELNSHRGYVIYSSLGSFFIPLVIMTIVYFEIFIATRSRLRERALSSRINTMSMTCQSGAPLRSAIDNASERSWTHFFLICCTAKKSTMMQTVGRPIRAITGKHFAKSRKVVMNEVDLESVSSENHSKHAIYETQPFQRIEPQNKESEFEKNVIEVDIERKVIDEGEFQTPGTAERVIDIVEVLVVKKMTRPPKFRDSIRQASRQIPDCHATKENGRAKKANTQENVLLSMAEGLQQDAEFDDIKLFMGNEKSIEIFLRGEEVTSVNDHEEENESLKTSPLQSSSGGVATSSMAEPLEKKSTGGLHQIIEERQKISLSKERRAARTLCIIMGIFVICWLPFSIMYVVLPFCESCCPTNKFKNFITWLGYVNSGLNPVIYTIFNLDYRRAFKRLLNIR